jgi:thioredoxin-like negative regulator of GroEL
METPAELVRLLLRTGYWSVWHGLYAEAAALFSGARAARPESEVPVLGMAVLAMVMQQADSAVQVLRETAMPLAPRSELVQAHLGCALRLAGREDEGREILGRLAASASDPDARLMAANLFRLEAAQLSPHLAKIL